jgi:uncharacterized protein
VRHVARRGDVRLMMVVCDVSEAVIRERLAARSAHGDCTSDARLEIWPALRAAYVEPIEVANALHIDTAAPLDENVNQVLRAIPHSTAGRLAPRAA